MNTVPLDSSAFVDLLAHETLSEIFLLTLPPLPDRFEPSILDSPLKLTLVNHKWRLVAFATPRLWSHLCITLGPVTCQVMASLEACDEFERKIKNQKEGAMRWLSLAKEIPTHVQFSIQNHGNLNVHASFFLRDHSFKVVLEALEEVCAEAFTKHWETLDIKGGALEYPYVQTVLSIPKERLPSLKTLHYSDAGGTKPTIGSADTSPRLRKSTFLKSGISQAPSLQAFHLGCVPKKDSPGNLLTPWDQITSLTLVGGNTDQAGSYRVDEVLTVISQCAPCLQALYVGFQEEEEGSIFSFPGDINLRVLENLTITELSPGNQTQRFMGSLSTPRLSYFCMELGWDDEEADWREDGDQLLDFSQLSRASITNITTLTLSYNYFSPAELKTLFKTMGSADMAVTSLNLEGVAIIYKYMPDEPCPYAALYPHVLELLNVPTDSVDSGEQKSTQETSRRLGHASNRESPRPPFPHLTSFDARLVREYQEGWDGNEFSDRHLLKFLHPRLQKYPRSVARLVEVNVGFVGEQQVDVLEALQKMEGVDLEGVDIYISYEEEYLWSDI